ncbi:MAG: glycosyltransferase [archaeon]|nr:glycosyltransferase [archaeon]MCP8305611.1 glycosyltransferase [archaeon]
MKVKDLPPSPSLEKYSQIVGEESIRRLEELADRLKGLKLQEINSARFGGGVAELLSSYVPFVNMLGIDIQWNVMEAEPSFFKITKTLHNFLQGRDGFSLSMADDYRETIRKNEGLIEEDCDVVTIHDPQPLGLIELLTPEVYEKHKMIWRCHVHLETVSSERMVQIQEFMRSMVERYHANIFSTFQFLPLWLVPSFIIPPFIDPLSDKNRELTAQEVGETLERYGINSQKPLITQVSRFDVFKNPIGVIKAFKLVRQKTPCQLLLVGGGASDDPEYQQVLNDTRRVAGRNPEIHILDLPPNSHREINAFQRASQVIVQKSVKEGFGLTVTEGLWKGKPVVGGKVGGIPLQIRDGWNGFLVSTVEEAAEKILYLLRHPKEAEEMGKKGREFVAQNFLLPRGVKDHLATIDQLINGKIVSKETIISYHPWY